MYRVPSSDPAYADYRTTGVCVWFEVCWNLRCMIGMVRSKGREDKTLIQRQSTEIIGQWIHFDGECFLG